MARTKARIFEEYLVASARLGDRTAAGRLAALRGPKLLAHAVRLLGDRADAEDVVQEAWIEIFRSLASLRDDRAFAAWAYRIVTRRAARLIDSRIRLRAATVALAAEAETTAEGAEPEAADAAAIQRAIAGLPPDQAATIALFYLEEMSVADVALALDVPPGTVKTRLMHARKRLHAILEGEQHEQA